MKLAALVGFATGTAISLWAFLRSLSHGESDFEADPLDIVQPPDPRLDAIAIPWINLDDTNATVPSPSWSTWTFPVDCE